MPAQWWVPLSAVVEADTAEQAYERMYALVGVRQANADAGVRVVIGPRDHVRLHQRGGE